MNTNIHPNDERRSGVPCPLCGWELKKPWIDGDWRDWDCSNFKCLFTIPDECWVDGKNLIRFLATQSASVRNPAEFIHAFIREVANGEG